MAGCARRPSFLLSDSFDLESIFPAEPFKKEFTDTILGTKPWGNTMTLLTGAVHWKFHAFCYKFTLSVQDNTTALTEKVSKIEELKLWPNLKRVYIPADIKFKES